MPEKTDPRVGLLKAEIVRLEEEVRVLDHQWGRKHWLGLIVLIAIPLMIGGAPPLWIVLAILGAPCLVATQAYLLYVRRAECRNLIEQARMDIARVQAGAPRMSHPSMRRA